MMGTKKDLTASVKELQAVVSEVNVQLATIGGHLETMKTRLESGARRFDGYDTDLRDVKIEIDTIVKDMTRLIINQRIFIFVSGTVGAVIALAVSAWINHLINMVMRG